MAKVNALWVPHKGVILQSTTAEELSALNDKNMTIGKQKIV